MSSALVVSCLIEELPEMPCTMISKGGWPEIPRKKLWGTLFASPICLGLNPTSSVSFSSLLPSFWLPLIYSPFPLFMDHATVFCCN
jgi:hypothetical protein